MTKPIKEIINIKELEKYIRKEFGKKCPKYSFGCYNCLIQRLMEDIRDLVEFWANYEKNEKK